MIMYYLLYLRVNGYDKSLAKTRKMIYNVYHKGENAMDITISKWGNSIGIRIPVTVTESLGLQAGDQVACELKDGGLFMRKQQSTSQMFEQFYGKPFDEITQDDLDSAEEIDWGEDVGGEVY